MHQSNTPKTMGSLIQKNGYTFDIVIVTLVSGFCQILISYCKFLMRSQRPLKWSILSASTIVFLTKLFIEMLEQII